MNLYESLHVSGVPLISRKIHGNVISIYLYTYIDDGTVGSM